MSFDAEAAEATVDSLEELSGELRPVHLAIGMFDGVHLGHLRVIGNAIERARAGTGLPAVLTFDPHPSHLFRPENPTPLILPTPLKVRRLVQAGIERVIVLPFNRDFARIAADAFAAHLKERIPALAGLYVGENFRFGARRAGDSALLEKTGAEAGLEVIAEPRLEYGGLPISSTRVRELLREGAVEQAGSLLGYPYFAEGPITPGRRLGRALGFPTLNIPWTPELLPRFGVYAVRARRRHGGNARPGVANFGLRPSVGDAESPLLEVHTLEETTLGPPTEMHVDWLRFIRPERKFASREELRASIARDRAEAERFFASDAQA
jgi:riboflavin kinase/FMN adenylyltransferase